MNLSDAEIGALQEAGAYRLGLFVRLEVDPVLRLWLGAGAIKPGTNTLDPTGETYIGAGSIRLPQFQQLINGASERIELGLISTDQRVLDLQEHSEAVRRKRCSIGFAFFDEAWALLGAVHWCRHYIADFLSIAVTGATDLQGQTVMAATLSIGSTMTGRRRRALSYYNQQEQQELSVDLNPDANPDRFCERTPIYSSVGQKTWPKYS